MKNKKLAFTLVELIVVITILAILATVGFVSFSWYLAWTRDTNRIAQLKSMSDALELYRTKKDLPIPDDKIDVQASGSIIAYQWYIWANVLETIEYTEKGLDPKDKTYFSYYLTKNKKYFQLMAFLEEENEDVLAWINIFNNSQAINYEERIPKVQWKKLWILTDENNTPIQEVGSITSDWYLDVSNTVDEYNAIFSDVDTLTWTWTNLEILQVSSRIEKAKNCKEIFDARLQSWNKIYDIYPDNKKVAAYCDMEIHGWWWTLVARSAENWTGDFGWDYARWNPDDENTPYSMWYDSENINFTQILFTRYATWKNIELAVELNVDNTIRMIHSTVPATTNTNCTVVYNNWIDATEKDWNHCRMFAYWWWIDRSTSYWFRDFSQLTGHSFWLMPGEIHTVNKSTTYGSFDQEQWMVFIR